MLLNGTAVTSLDAVPSRHKIRLSVLRCFTDCARPTLSVDHSGQVRWQHLRFPVIAPLFLAALRPSSCEFI